MDNAADMAPISSLLGTTQKSQNIVYASIMVTREDWAHIGGVQYPSLAGKHLRGQSVMKPNVVYDFEHISYM